MSYTTNIPAANDNPSVSQGQMQANFNEINTFVNVNHGPFNGATEGKHLFVEMPKFVNALPAVPTTLVNEGSLFTQTPSGVTNLYYTSDAGGNAYQLTRTIDASYANIFGANYNNYGAHGVNYTGGWTFLPGGLLLQYGSVANATNGTVVYFPVNFSTGAYSIQLSQNNSGSHLRQFLNVLTSSPSTSQFTLAFVDQNNNNANPTTIYWTAIGN